MELEKVIEQINNMSLSDTLRVYLFLNNKIEQLKKTNAQHISKMLYYVKNAEKEKQRIQQNRKMKQATE